MRLLINNIEIEIKRLNVNEIDIRLIEYLLQQVKGKPCVEYETVTGVTYELCRDMLMPNRFTLNIYYKV